VCGVCGIHHRNGGAVDPSLVGRMSDTIAHRGPDDEGSYVTGGLGLGFRRLSIIDLDGGHQPMGDDTGSVRIVFNGEIYNFADLRTELERRGRRFRTRSDTEVIVHGYLEWGLGVLDRLNGMFGLAIWDARTERLVLARDRAGVKPIYWALDGDRLLFGSELRAVLAGMPGRPALDPSALALFLRFRYVPAPFTLQAGIRKLAPGTMLVVDRDGMAERSWWSFAPTPLDPVPTVEEATEHLLDLYRSAVRRQLVSDVPLGILLSGGLDSGLLLALMQAAEPDVRWPAFTIGFGDGHEGDELDAGTRTADLFGADHVRIELDRDDFERSLPSVVRALEEPVASPSVVPMYWLCERASRDVKVVLTGQGPDELFGGYRRHLGVRYGERWRSLPPPVRAAAGRTVHGLPRTAAWKRGVDALGEGDRFRRWQQTLALVPAATVHGLFRAEVRGRLVDDGAALEESWRGIVDLAAGADELSGFQYLEIRSTLPDELLMYSDKLSMAHGLEARVPFLDQEVIEYALGLPPAYKIRHRTQKWLHREVCRRYLPPEILHRPKRGFAVDVVDQWYRSAATSMLDETLLDPGATLYQLLDARTVARLVSEHRSGRRDHHKLLHSLVVAELWLRELPT
jgi:asparagine synthase (glutamine-hydrolysing)